MTPGNGDKHVLLGMSGGVDSSVAAFLLQQQGWQVRGLSLLTHDACRDSLIDAQAMCAQLGIPWEMLDVRREFRDAIIADFISGYIRGRTPNPCVLCNPTIKFAALGQAADRLGCSHIATGHYAAIRRLPETGRLALAKSAAGQKDQTYFMYRLSQEQLARLIFPLSGYCKDHVREIAAAAGLAGQTGRLLAQKPDSQDNCFIPCGDYPAFILEELTRAGNMDALALTKPGPVVNTSGQQIGIHKGLIHYTLGQRKGFQVQTTDRLFVLGKKPAVNSLVVGSYDQLQRREIRVAELVFSGLPAVEPGMELEARIRNSAQEVPCRVYPEPDKNLRAVFHQPVIAPAPGQSCVFYRDGLIMAGGFIEDSK